MYEGNILPRILEGLLSFAKARKHGWKSAFHPWKSWMERFLATRVDGCFTCEMSWPEISASRRLGTVRETAYILPLTLAAKAKGPINFPSDWSSFYPVPFCSNCCYLFVNYSANYFHRFDRTKRRIMIKKKRWKGWLIGLTWKEEGSLQYGKVDARILDEFSASFRWKYAWEEFLNEINLIFIGFNWTPGCATNKMK